MVHSFCHSNRMYLPLDYTLRSKIIKNTKPITKKGRDVRLSHKAVKGSIIGMTTKAMPRAKKPTSIEAQKESIRVFTIVLIITITIKCLWLDVKRFARLS